MLPVLVLIAACAGETTAPDSPANPSTPAAPTTPVGFRVLPGTITIEVNQRIRFRGELRSVRGEVSAPQITWTATGGTIDSRGTFHATRPGKYRVVGRGHGRGSQRPDTSVVVVVPRQPGMLGIRVTPRTPRLEPGQKRTFTAVGRLGGGKTAPIGVTWSATGGEIDPAGVYRAGEREGKFRVIARNLRGDHVDTIPVVIRVPTLPDTLDSNEPDPVPAPALASVVLKPDAIFLATHATHQFAAYGRNAAGDSVTVDVTFAASGGSISETGLFTAGQTAGSYRVIATASSLADTALVTVARSSGGGTPPTPVPNPPGPGPTPLPPTPPAPGGTGIPMGIFGLLSEGVEPQHYTMAVDGYTSGNIVGRIADARRMKIRLFLNMTGGHHKNYMTNGVFDMAKWRAKMDSYNTPSIRAAIASAVADGTIIGNSVMDEPANVSASNSWGPAGTMNKARVDEMCYYVKQIFPTMPVGVLHDHRILEPTKGYQHCEFLVSQYRLSKGDIRQFRDGGLAFAKQHNMQIIFSLNILHGGNPGTDCEKWGDDPRGVLCPMSPTQLREWGTMLGEAGCAFMMWKYERAYINKPEIQAALRDVAASLSRVQRKSCGRA